MPIEDQRDLFQKELDELHDIRLGMVELLKFFLGKTKVEEMDFRYLDYEDNED